MKRRRALGLALAVSSVWICALSFVACSTEDGGAATDVTGGDASGDGRETDLPAPSRDGAAVREGGCTAVKGPCDLVVQDCADDAKGQKQECVVARASNGRLTTASAFDHDASHASCGRPVSTTTGGHA